MKIKALVTIASIAGLSALSLTGGSSAHEFNNSQGWQNGWGQGQGQGHMMGQGQMMGQGHMMGRGNTGAGMMQPLREDLTTDDVKHMMGHRLSWMSNPNIQLGKVEEKDADTIIADIVTKDGSIVQRLQIDRHTGWMQPVQ